MSEDEVTKDLLQQEPSQEPKQEVELSAEEKDFRDFVGVEHAESSDPAWDNKRFRQIYKKFKDRDRTVEERDKDVDAMRSQFQLLFESTKKLNKSAEALAEVEKEKKANSIENDIASLEETLSSLKDQRKEFRTVGEWDKVDALDDKIESTKEKLSAKKDNLAKNIIEKVKTKEPEPDNGMPPELKSTFEKWWKDATWADPRNMDTYDPLMVEDAKKLDEFYLNSGKWTNKPILERFKAVQEKIEARYGYKKEAVKKGINSVEGGNDYTPPENSKLELDDNMRRVARNLFPDLPAKEAEKKYLAEATMIQRRA
jgi:uncharacterized protein YoxC